MNSKAIQSPNPLASLGGLYALSGFFGPPSRLAHTDPLGLSKRLGETHRADHPDLARPPHRFPPVAADPHYPAKLPQKPTAALRPPRKFGDQLISSFDPQPPRRSADVKNYDGFLPASPPVFRPPARPTFDSFKADLRPLAPQRLQGLPPLSHHHSQPPPPPQKSFNHKTGETEGAKKNKKKSKSRKEHQFSLPPPPVGGFFDDRQLQVAQPVAPPPRPRPTFPPLPTFNLRRPALNPLIGLFGGRPSAPLRLAPEPQQQQQQSAGGPLSLEPQPLQLGGGRPAPSRPGSQQPLPPLAARPPPPPTPVQPQQRPAAQVDQPEGQRAVPIPSTSSRPVTPATRSSTTMTRPSPLPARSTQPPPSKAAAAGPRPLPPVENSSFRNQGAPVLPSDPAAVPAGFGNAFAGTSGDPFSEFRGAR